MDAELRNRLSAITWSLSATVSIAFRKADIRKILPGFGFIVPRIENRRINACTWSSIKWEHRAADDTLLIRSFVGGGHHEELISLGDTELVTTVLEELHEIIGLTTDASPTEPYQLKEALHEPPVSINESLNCLKRKEIIPFSLLPINIHKGR